MATLHVLLYASKAYCYAKNNSGPLKPKVETIEGTLKTVVSPTYDKYHHVPVEFLKFVDRKVDETVDKFGNQVQPFVKQVSTKTKNLSAEVKTAGLEMNNINWLPSKVELSGNLCPTLIKLLM
ncbi:putative rubber elongation factor [Helianthus debilis subsp. tardiflorus]